MTTIAHPAPHRTGGCGCGGKCGCENHCCDLECLVRPNYFCGQLLTDADLRAMVQWSRDRFALQRYRDGWGVVCGLEITCGVGGDCGCGPSAARGTSVTVQPGYAIDCCGNDLVVCEPIVVDLSGACRPGDDVCGETKPPEGEGGGTSDGPPECFPEADRVAVDLTLRYGEKLTQGQRTMFRSGCSDIAGCEYGRVQERPTVELEVQEAGVAPDEEGTRKEELTKAAKEILKEIQSLQKLSATRLIHQLRHHPPHALCFIEEWLCCQVRLSPLVDEDDVARGREELNMSDVWPRLTPWMWADRVLQLLACRCASCRTDQGVPIGRVLLQRAPEQGGRCRVFMIEAWPPYRRPLRRDCEEIDLSKYLWRRLDVVSAALMERGAAKVVEEPTGGSPEELE